MFLEQQISILE